MRVDGALVVVHSAQIHACGHDDRYRRLSACDWATHFLIRVGAGPEAWDGLDNGAAARTFDEVEHEQFWGCDVVLMKWRLVFNGTVKGECKWIYVYLEADFAPGSSLIIERKLGDLDMLGRNSLLSFFSKDC